MSSDLIKLSSPETKEFWKVPVLFEDEHLLALDKPSQLLSSPDRYDPQRPNLMKLLHRDIERGAAWARERGLSYLMNAHRLDFDTTGIILLAKSKPVLVQLVSLFGAQKPVKQYLALVQGQPMEDAFTIEARLAPHPVRIGRMRVDDKRGKNAITKVKVLERFRRWTLLECYPLTGRTHQIRAHLRHLHLPLVGDTFYGGKLLMLSTLKPDYRLKRDQVERPLISRAALHAAALSLRHPVSGVEVKIESPWPKDLAVAVKYLRRFVPG